MPSVRRGDHTQPTIFTLKGAVQPYAWGNVGAIAALLGTDIEGPAAEYWMGAHPSAPSLAVEAGQTLDAVISADPSTHLGSLCDPNDRASELDDTPVELPFLMKVLAAAAPLSIQTHPTAEQAQAGFEAENAAGVPLQAPHRVFRDANPKPELVVSLGDFSARVGFRPIEETKALFAAIARAEPDAWDGVAGQEIDTHLTQGGYEAVLGWLVSRPETTQKRLAEIVLDAADHLGVTDAETVRCAATHHRGDVGILTLILLNQVKLAGGEAIFLTPGTLHSYLGGLAIEVMANSDNVVRGGLTQKHIDPTRLLAMVTTRPETPQVQRPTAPIWRYDSDGANFSLVAICNDTYQSDIAAPRIAFVSSGTARIEARDEHRIAPTGTAFYIPAGSGAIEIQTDGVVWVTEGR